MILETVMDVGSRVNYRLVDPLHSQGITVPAGFVTDFGSVPTALEWVVSGEDNHLVLPSIVHDWIYQNRGEIPEGSFTRKQADQMLLEGMRLRGAGWWKRNAVYLAVRLGGGKTWRT